MKVIVGMITLDKIYVLKRDKLVWHSFINNSSNTRSKKKRVREKRKSVRKRKREA